MTPSENPVELIPRLREHVHLKRDDVRKRWILLAPERMLVLDDIAHEILQLCDGIASLTDIVSNLATAYNAPEERIDTDVRTLLAKLRQDGFVDF